MQFIKHNPFQRREKIRCVVGRQQQRELFGGREQNIRRIFALALPPRYRRVAGAGLNPHRQLHVGNRPFEIAGDIHRQRLQWRNVERVQATATHDTASGRYCFRGFGLGRAEFHQCRQESRQRLACACRRDQQRRAVAVRFRHQIKLMRARRPAPAPQTSAGKSRAANQAMSGSWCPLPRSKASHGHGRGQRRKFHPALAPIISDYWLTGFASRSQSLPLKVPMNSVLIGE